MEVICTLCGEAVDPAKPLTIAHQVTGWEFPRLQGGTNALRLRRRSGTVAHRSCVIREIMLTLRGVDREQPELWSG